MSESPGKSSSVASSSASSPAPVLARKSVKDLLAELSDSESEAEPVKRPVRPASEITAVTQEGEEDSSEDEVVLGGGRLAARLQGDRTQDNHNALGKNIEHARAETQASTSEDELARKSPLKASSARKDMAFQPKRRLLLKRKRSDDSDEPPSAEAISRIRSRSGTPTPTHSSHASSPNSVQAPAVATAADNSGKSKFELLIEKARNERLAREAAEAAKKAARAAERSSSPKRKIPRGSSPADGSEDSENSDSGAAERLSKATRPSRKASKKALEEMNRETQRMNRNMQLAHQATTKKKFTKQGFFDTFNKIPQTSSSSAPSSDNEHQQLHSTPPTSPILEPGTPKQVTAIAEYRPLVEREEDEVLDVPDLMEIIEQRRKLTEPKQVEPTNVPSQPTTIVQAISVDATKQVDDESDSGSDIEIVADRASRRKYAVFENMPKRKAQESSSHLVLRALAHVKKHRDKKSLMSNADMGSNLLRAARNQAQEERNAKLEKLRAAGVVIQTAEERAVEEEELEDLVEKARQEDEEIRKREKRLAKKHGTYVKDALDDEDSDDDEDDDFVGSDGPGSGSEDDENAEHEDELAAADGDDEANNDMIDNLAEESDEEVASDNTSEKGIDSAVDAPPAKASLLPRTRRGHKLVIDDDEDEVLMQQTPALPQAPTTPLSILRSARRIIPGLEQSNLLPMGLTQAFAATMADSQTQDETLTQEQGSMDILRDMPSPLVALAPRLERLDSIDAVSESITNSQTQPMDLNLGLTQSQRVPESPSLSYRPSQICFELTQDKGYVFSPFKGDRFAETPAKEPHSTEDTILIPHIAESPIVQRKGKLQRGRQLDDWDEEEDDDAVATSAFNVMKRAAKQKEQQDFDKKKSAARRAVDEAAEESDDEYAGLGGASDDESGEENEDDRKMIDEDTQVGRGDEAKLAKLHADRERESDEAAVSKLLKDIITGGLRRKRAAGDDLDLSDEEDATARRREAKRREFAKMRRELLKDEAVNKIADDQKKQAFLKSIEDQDEDGDADDFDRPETQLDDEDSQDPSEQVDIGKENIVEHRDTPGHTLQPKSDSALNAGTYDHRKVKLAASRKPSNLAEIRDQLSFLIEEPESQSDMVDLGLSDSEEEPEAYVNLDRHFRQAEADEEAMMDENDDLGDFVVADVLPEDDTDDATFKKPGLPASQGIRAPFSERRTKATSVVDRLDLLRQNSSSVGSNASSKMAFMSGKAGSHSTNSVPTLLRRATTNSGLGSASGRETVSATGVVTNKTERGSVAQEKNFVRKGANTSRNAINYQKRQNLKEEKMSARAGIAKQQQQKKKGGSFLTGLFRGDTWA